MSILHTCTEGSEFYTKSGLCYRKVSLNKNSDSVVPHCHAFDHDMIVTSGTVLVTLDDIDHKLHVGNILTVPATAVHSVVLCPCADLATFLCVWPFVKGNSYEDTTRAVTL